MKLDLNRGVVQRRHPQGFWVAMYVDRPGEYLNINEQPVGEDVAQAAGFDIPKLAKQRAHKAKLAEAMQKVNAEFDEMELGTVVHEAGEWRVTYAGEGRFNILDADGDVQTDHPTTREEAVKLVDELAAGA